METTRVVPPNAISPFPYDAQELWSIFKHNKGSTLTYGEIRHRLLKANGKITNERQNAALDHLELNGFIDKVSHGRWRYKKPSDDTGRPSATVVASAPITPELAAQIVPRFKGAMTDAVYSALRERNKPMATYDLIEALGIRNNKTECQNCSSSLQTLDRLGWLDVDRTNPRRLLYTALAINKHGDDTRGALKHASADPIRTLTVRQAVEEANAHLAAGTFGQPPAPTNGQASNGLAAMSLEQILRYAGLREERALIQKELDETYAPKLQRLQEIDLELAGYE